LYRITDEERGQYMDEQKLIERIQSGDRRAFDELVLGYQNKVIHISYGMLSDYQDACDAAQEVFVKVYRSIDRFRGDSSLSTWIYRITKNVCSDFLRKRKDPYLSIDEEKEEGTKLEIVDTSKSPEQIAEKNEIQRIVHEALGELDDNSRLMITMFDLEGLSYEEISAALEIPIGTVKSRLNRAREKLKKNLANNREHFL